MTREVLQKGEKYDTPNDGATVQIDYKGSYNGKVFDEKSVTFNINEGTKICKCENDI